MNRSSRFTLRALCATALLAAAAVAGLWLARLDFRAQFSTDVLDLIPAEASSPELQLVHGAAQHREARVLLFALREAAAPARAPNTAAERFAETLRASGHCEIVLVLGGAAALEESGRELFAQRIDLLWPAWLEPRAAEWETLPPPERPALAEWLAQRAVAELGEFLQQPDSVAFHDLLGADPLLLLPRLAQSAALPLPGEGSSEGFALVWAMARQSPFSEEGQGPLLAAIADAERAAREIVPSLELHQTMVARFAASSRAHIQQEVYWLNFASLAAVAAVASLFLRRPWQLLHTLPTVLLGLLGAWTTTTLIFPRVHVLVTVVGSLLTGVTIDYGIHLLMRHAAETGTAFRDHLRQVVKPLLASCGTTIAGFAFLLGSELLVIRQIGVFVTSGLACALAAGLLYALAIDATPLVPRWSGNAALRRRPPRGLGFAGLVLAMLAATGWLRLHWHDDIRELEVPNPALRAEDAEVRAAFGQSDERVTVLAIGATLAEARERLEAIATEGDWNLRAAVPTPQTFERARQRAAALENFATALERELTAAGYERDAFEPFFTAWDRARREAAARDYEQTVREFAADLRGPLGLLVHAQPGLNWFVSSMPAESAPQRLPADVMRLSQLDTLNHIFARYRLGAWRLSLAGLGVVAAGLLCLYGWRRAAVILAVPAVAAAGALGLLGWTQGSLNLFHLLGLFLGVCISLDYAVFATEPRPTRGALPVSIRLAAMTTLAAFTILAASAIPVVSALGWSVAAMVGLAWLALEVRAWREQGRI